MHKTMKKNISQVILKGQPIGADDAARLVLEAIERLGESVEGATRIALVGRLRRVIELGVAAMRNEEQTVTFETAAWGSVESRAARRPTTKRDLRHFVRRMLRVQGVSERPLRAMTVRECRDLLQAAFGSSAHSYRKGRAILHSIFVFGRRHEWCTDNPVDCIESPSVTEKEIVPLKVEEVEKLEQTATRAEHADMRLSLHLLTYCGLRPAEVARLQPQDIRWDESEVVVRPKVSKTGGGRVVPIRCIKKLRGAPLLIPRNWQKRWYALRRASGMHKHWQADVLRHTFATYHAAFFRNLPELQMEMGHRDLSLLRSRYTVPTSREAAAHFWASSCRGGQTCR